MDELENVLEGEEHEYRYVTFVSGDDKVKQRVNKGETVTPPATFTRDGYILYGWFT